MYDSLVDWTTKHPFIAPGKKRVQGVESEGRQPEWKDTQICDTVKGKEKNTIKTHKKTQ